MAMTKYGARPEQTSKTAEGAPGRFDPSRLTKAPPVHESLKEKLEREKKTR